MIKTRNIHRRVQHRPFAVALMLGGTLSTAFATDGYFSHGYGMNAKGMGGASVALAQDGFAGANNPAAAAWAGNRAELGLDFFKPTRSMERAGLGTVTSDHNLFYIPEFGYNQAISDKLGVGVTVYGNGGMNTDYAGGQIPANGCGPGSPPSNVFCGSGRLGVDLMQLIVAPTVAYKFSENHSIGISPLLVRQQFKADGLNAFGVANSGYDSSNGFGVRLGYLGKLTDQLSIGASYSPRIAMSKLSQYAGLFAEQGGLDIPENYVVGASFQATPNVTIALDYQRINYGAIASIANASNSPGAMGAANGPGFGWSNIDVWKLGVQWQASPKLTLRAGVNIGGNPIQSRDASLNTLAPGVITTHYTLGGTYALTDRTDVTFSYMHAPSNSVTGPNRGGGTDTIKMSEQALGVQFGWKF
ncbi:outer membrane protein transport protein [Polaromonas sp.]|uniref:OmpP1/FadL family transporter n=1 Tax=Polaromonas sp. TaxID=1869339 RepID=UPI0025FC6E58|nr:outer membrane protein transport protein [Polaromonas sp.]